MNYNILLVIAISLFGWSSGDPCGPYACLDLRTVKHCGNVQYCIDNVWSKIPPTGKRDNVCDICLRMVKEARDQLESNETMSEIKEVLEGSCKLLLLKPAVKMCSKLADEFSSELVAILASQMDPEVVCTVAKLCNNEEFRLELEMSRKCTDCRNFLSAATDLIEKIPADDFKDEILELCRTMGSYSDACYFYAPLFADFYYNQTQHALAKRPCEVMGFCPMDSEFALRNQNPSQTWKEAREKMCSLCPTVFENLKVQLLNTKSPKEFRNELYKVCRALALEKSSCSKIISGYSDKIYSSLRYDFDPVYFCSHNTGFCNVRSEPVPVWPLLPASSPDFENLPTFHEVMLSNDMISVGVEVGDNEPVERFHIALGDPLEPKPLLSYGSNENCKTCANMFDTLNQLLTNDKNFLNKILDSVCNDMPKPESCRNFIELFSGEMRDVLLNKFGSHKVCPELVPKCTVTPYSLRLSDKVSPDGACSFCRKAYQILRQSLEGEEPQAELTKTLDGLCKSMPKESQVMCHSFVQTFVEKTLISGLSKFNENETCNYFKLCGSAENELTTQVQNVGEEVGKGSCNICLMVIQTAIDQLKDKSSEEEIRKVLESLCNGMPSKFKNRCVAIVDNYSDEIVKLIMSNLNPNEICERLHFCDHKNTTSAPTTAVSQMSVTETKHSGELDYMNKNNCKFCIMALEFLMKELEDDKTEESIRKAIKQLCNYLPEETQDVCHNLVEQYTDAIVDMIIADFNATEVCIYLKFCGPKASPAIENYNLMTNEIHGRYNPAEACETCRSLQQSMIVPGNEEKAVEGILAFLADVCLMDSEDMFTECKNMVKEKIFPFGKDYLFEVSNICEEFKLCSSGRSEPDKALLRRMRLAVQECAMCETLVDIIANHENMLVKNYDFTKASSIICSTVPTNKKSMCQSMMISYGPSIVNVIVDKHISPEKVCSELSLCDESQQAKLHMPVSELEPTKLRTEVDTGECLQGPSFWCANEENAKKCGTIPHCKETVWKNGIPPK